MNNELLKITVEQATLKQAIKALKDGLGSPTLKNTNYGVMAPGLKLAIATLRKLRRNV